MDPQFTPTQENQISPTVHKTQIEGLYYIPHRYFPDDRGFYSELARIPEIDTLTGETFITKQLNQSRSNTNVIRGIHAEDWNKLITVTSGLCFCALVDLRKDSATFGKHQTFLLGSSSKALRGSLYVARGIGNSFCVLEGPADYVYAVDALWAERDIKKDVAINVFDPDIAIQWPIPKEHMQISQRDLESIQLQDL